MRKKMLFSMMFMAGIAGGLVTVLLLILMATSPSMSLPTAFLSLAM